MSTQRHREDHDRDEQRREEEVGLAAELVGGAPAHRDRRDREQQTEEHRARVAHEDPRRAEVVRAGSPTHIADRDDRDERRDVRAVEQTGLQQPVGVEEQREPGDDDDPGGEPVETVDQVDRVGEHHDRDAPSRTPPGRATGRCSRSSRTGRGSTASSRRTARAGCPRAPGRRPSPAATPRGRRRPRRRTNITPAASRSPSGSDDAVEHLVELVELRRGRERGAEPDEHRRAAERRRRVRVDATAGRACAIAPMRGASRRTRNVQTNVTSAPTADDQVAEHGSAHPHRVPGDSGATARGRE